MRRVGGLALVLTLLVLLDACHSGATTAGGSRLAMDATALRTALAAAKRLGLDILDRLRGILR